MTATAEHLAWRKRITSRSAARHRIVRPTPAEPPDALVREYTRKYARLWRALMREFVADLLALNRRHDAPGYTRFIKTFGDLLVHYGDRITERFTPLVGEQTEAVSEFNKGQVSRVWERLLSLPYTDKPGIARALEGHRDRNIGLITKLSAQSMGSVKAVLDANPGASADDLQARILEVVATSESHARFLARDQVLKLNGSLTMERHKSAGIDRYEWVTSNDDRVREYHAALDGQEFSWSEPPIVSKDGRREHPGGDYQCRCIANPVIDLDKIV